MTLISYNTAKPFSQTVVLVGFQTLCKSATLIAWVAEKYTISVKALHPYFFADKRNYGNHEAYPLTFS